MKQEYKTIQKSDGFECYHFAHSGHSALYWAKKYRDNLRAECDDCKIIHKETGIEEID